MNGWVCNANRTASTTPYSTLGADDSGTHAYTTNDSGMHQKGHRLADGCTPTNRATHRDREKEREQHQSDRRIQHDQCELHVRRQSCLPLLISNCRCCRFFGRLSPINLDFLYMHDAAAPNEIFSSRSTHRQ